MQRIPGLLIIEGNADRLAREGMSKQLDRLERLLDGNVAAGQLRVKRLPIRNKTDLEFARTFAPYARYDAVLLLAHGALDGAEATASLAYSWSDIAQMLAPVEPRALLAISCWANSSGPARALFEGIPSLVAIGGSPTTLSIKQAKLAFMELLFAAFDRALPAEFSALVSLYNVAETGGLVVWRRRETFERASANEHLLLDIGSVIAKFMLDIDRA